MLDDRNKMRHGDMPLLDRIDVALRRVTSGEGHTRVPAEATDPDVVLFDCKREIERLRTENGRLREDADRHRWLGHDLPSLDRLDAAIERVLAEVDRLRTENGRLREFERSAALTLPGVYYMDPPDGGDVSLLKQLQRMSIDAARYRLLRRKFAIISDGNGNAEFCPINLPRPTYIAPNTAIELDTALDRERLGMDAAANDKTKEDTDAR